MSELLLLLVVRDLALQIPILVYEYVQLLPQLVNVLPLHLQVLHVQLRILEALACCHLILHQFGSDVLTAGASTHLGVQQALVLYRLEFCCRKELVSFVRQGKEKGTYSLGFSTDC